MKVTTNHEEIKSWITTHDGKPDLIQTPGVGNSEEGLRIDFPGKEDEEYFNENTKSEDISWNEFFKRFEEWNLAFMYEEKTRGKNLSNAYRFIKRDQLDNPDKI